MNKKYTKRESSIKKNVTTNVKTENCDNKSNELVTGKKYSSFIYRLITFVFNKLGTSDVDGWTPAVMINSI